MRSPPALALVALSVACRKPPEAPAELDELCGYLYAHFADEDPIALEVGMDNLDDWLDKRLDETLEGYTVGNLSQSAVDALDDQARDLTGLLGAAVGTESAFGVNKTVDVLVKGDPVEVYEDTYLVYDRDFETDAQCFVDDDCEMLEVTNDHTADYPLGVEVASTSIGQYRWVEPSAGRTVIQRTWLVGPGESNVDWLSIDETYFLRALLPTKKGTVHLQTTWIVASLGDSPVPENLALQMVIDSMRESEEYLEAYLSGE